MNKIYKKIVAYDPTKKAVSCIRLLTYREAIDNKASDEAFYDVYNKSDHKREIIVGFSLAGNHYQLSPASYGTYIKENEGSMKFIDTGHMLVAVAKYHDKNKLPYSYFGD